ncbi:MAG: DNA-3-methyladenine glycosylase family protein [Candidatus Anammoxibacter sp.]
MAKLKVEDFNLSYTLECGQIFRVNKHDDWYYVNSMDKLIKVRQKGDSLEYYGANRSFMTHFFSLDVPLKKIVKEINKDKYIKQAVKEYKGLRLIRQHPWECLISFIFSAASNIPRIKSCMDGVAEHFGKRITIDGFESYTFPNCGKINNTKKLEKAKPGFRGKYVLEASATIKDGYLDSLRALPYEQAKDALKEIKGVADKVADCVLLFSLDFMEAFPVDTWISKIMQELYFKNNEVPNKEIRRFADDYFGPYAGYAQQYLFMYARSRASSTSSQRTEDRK